MLNDRQTLELRQALLDLYFKQSNEAKGKSGPRYIAEVREMIERHVDEQLEVIQQHLQKNEEAS